VPRARLGARERPPFEGVVLVGVGNPLRRDDGVGPAVAAAVGDDLEAGGARVLEVGQLLPELVEELVGARRVVVVDASSALPPGAVRVERLGPGPSPATGAPLSHGCSLEELLALCAALYGVTPAVSLVSVGAGSFEIGAGLSPVVQAAFAAACQAALDGARDVVGDPPGREVACGA